MIYLDVVGFKDWYCVFVCFVFVFEVVGRILDVCRVGGFVVVDVNVVNYDVVYILGSDVSFFSNVYIGILFI